MWGLIDRGLPSLSGIVSAQELLAPYNCETPLIHSRELSEEFAADIWIKNETVSPIRCFKHRGALTELLRAGCLGPISAVVTSSTGNHGLGVAYAAKELARPAHIFLPESASVIKRAGIEALGGTVHIFGADIDDAKVEARSFSRRHRYTFVDDGESLGVIEGAGTIGLEIVQKLNDIDFVFVPMGSGSLGSGCACAIKGLSPESRVICVQSCGSPAMSESFRRRRPVAFPIDTIADGLVCREPADLALRALLAFVDEVEVVADGQILAAVFDLAVKCDFLLEPSGAAALAAIRNRRDEIAGKRVVFVATGANISREMLEVLNLRHQ